MSVRPFRFGHAAAERWQDAARAVLDQLGEGGGNVGFLYAGDAYAEAMPDIVAFFRQHTGIEHWVGTVGMGIVATDREYLDEPALAVMLADFPDHGYRVWPGQHVGAVALALEDGRQAHFAVLHGDPGNQHMPQLLHDAAAATVSGFVVGGLTSSRSAHTQLADDVTTGGLSGLLLGDEVEVVTNLTQGVSPLPHVHVITECERNIVVSLDHRPALDVLREDIGEVLARDLERIGGYIFVGLPIQGSDTGDYLVRNLVGIDTENGLIAVGDLVQNGQRLMFCRRDGDAAWQDLDRMLRQINSRLEAPPRGALYFSCLGRGPHMFGPDSAELKRVSDALGGAPLVGFFANGEISHDRLYGYTGVLTVFP
jgi:small ligand-binding sensory domain FIST